MLGTIRLGGDIFMGGPQGRRLRPERIGRGAEVCRTTVVRGVGAGRLVCICAILLRRLGPVLGA